MHPPACTTRPRKNVPPAALLYAWTRARGATPPGPRHWRPAIVSGGLLFLGGHGALAWAEQRVSSGSAALLIATIPLWAVLLEWASPGGERPRPLGFAGLATGEPRALATKIVSLLSLAALAYLVLFASILAFTAYAWLLRVSTPARATSFAFVNPPVALLLGWAAGDEAPSLRTGLAALAIIGALALVFAARHAPFSMAPKTKKKEVHDDRAHMAGRHAERQGGYVSRLPQEDGC